MQERQASRVSHLVASFQLYSPIFLLKTILLTQIPQPLKAKQGNNSQKN